MKGLDILQCNAGKSAGRQKKTLLAIPRMQDYDIIALQEPSFNSQTGPHSAAEAAGSGQYMRRGRNRHGWLYSLIRGWVQGTGK